MARRFGLGNNFSGNWGTEHSSTVVHDARLSVNVAKQSEPFTASSLSDSDVGMAFYVYSLASIGSEDRLWRIRLIENGVSKRETTIPIKHINDKEKGMIIIKWDTPYQYTSLTSGYYWYEIISEYNGGTEAVMQEYGNASKFAYIGFNDVASALSSGDKLFIPRDGAETIDADFSLGDGTGTTSLSENWDSAINLCGTLTLDDTSDRVLTLRGSLALECGGTLGDLATKNNNHTFLFDYTTGGEASDSFGIFTRKIHDINIIGTDREHLTRYASGNGNTASPLLILEDLELTTDDLICISATSNILETEYKYILSGDYTNGYVLADTQGGIESGLSYTHSTVARIGSLTRNIVFTTNDITKGFFMDENKRLSLVYNLSVNKISSCHITRNNKWNIQGTQFTNIVNFETLSTTISLSMGINVPLIHDRNIFAKTLNQVNGSTGAISFTTAAVNQTMRGSLFISMQVNALNWSGNSTGLLNCDILDGNTVNSSNGGVIRITAGLSNGFISACYFDGIRRQVFKGYASCNFVCNSSVFGTLIPCSRTFEFNSNACTWDILLNNCTINDISLGDALQEGLGDSSLRFQNCKLTGYTSNYNIINLLSNGIIEKTGKDTNGLDLNDNKAFTTGNNCVGIFPNALGELTYTFKIEQRPEYVCMLSAFIEILDADALDTTTISLFKDNSAEADDEIIFTGNTSKVFFSLSSDNNSNYSSYATLKIAVNSASDTTKIYIGDFYNGLNDFTALRTWDEGYPVPLIETIVFNSNLAQTLSYQGVVWIDITSGYSGVIFPVGTSLQPVNNLADALAISTKIGAKQFRLLSDLTIDSNFENKMMSSGIANLTITLVSSVDGSSFKGITLTGTQEGICEAHNCTLLDLKGINGSYYQCGFSTGVQTFKNASETTFHLCFSKVTEDNSPIFDFSSTGGISVNFKAYSGSLQIVNFNHTNTKCAIEFLAGKLNIASGEVTAGILNARGVFHDNDFSDSSLVVKKGTVLGADISDLNYSQNTLSGITKRNAANIDLNLDAKISGIPNAVLDEIA